MTKDISVLIIDDDENFAGMLKASFEDMNYICRSEISAAAGIEYALMYNPDVVLVDLRMPEKSGIEVIREIRSRKSDLPLIVISGTVDVNEAVNCIREGADDYILKPILETAELEIRIEHALEKYALKKEIKKYQLNLELLIGERTQQLIERTNELVNSNIQLEEEIKRRIEAENLVKKGTSNIMKTLEIERQRLSQELHDSIGQRLMFAKLNLEIAQKEMDSGNENLTASLQNLTLISSELSSIIKSLFPVSIEKYSFAKNLSALISEFEKSSRMKVEYYEKGIEPFLTKFIKLNLYRVFQEIFNNITKHSKAEIVLVNVIYENNNITMTVQDNGVGLPADLSAEQSVGTGFFSIQERISQLNGTVSFSSETGKGLLIKIEVPV